MPLSYGHMKCFFEKRYVCEPFPYHKHPWDGVWICPNAEAAEVQRARMDLQYKIHPKLQVKHLLIRNQTRTVFGHRIVETLKKNYYTSDEIDPNWVPVKTEELVQTLSENISKNTEPQFNRSFLKRRLACRLPWACDLQGGDLLANANAVTSMCTEGL